MTKICGGGVKFIVATEQGIPDGNVAGSCMEAVWVIWKKCFRGITERLFSDISDGQCGDRREYPGSADVGRIPEAQGGQGMLEFQEGFFKQEIRDGFYLDTTMKTLWAAELEVLQMVAGICARHGLQWYAAYGTLLGAIRHEGFVPWDDDMDIWVKHPDYNKLMQILPKELPESFRVRSPQTDEGYEQFHTCLNNGDGINVTAAWMEQYHGCPFTVGLDIFPLDYLPRNRKERMRQRELFTMAARIAQLAKNVGRGEYDAAGSGSSGQDAGREGKVGEENKTREENKAARLKKSVIDEIKLGIRYLEKNYKLRIDHRLLRDEKWDRVSSELWQWANYLAMIID